MGNNSSFKRQLLTGIFLAVISFVQAQISPGDLTSVHAHLEGISNCTKCHVLGDKVSNDKCLECHKELKTNIALRKGFHASSEVTGKACFACHSEHHGRNFEIVRFDTEKFNHQLTGYRLTGAHLKAQCSECHKDEFISSAELKKKDRTYLGLRTECIACHKDVHQNSLGSNCASCHNTEAFEPAALFDHAKTDFPLKGKHKTVDCRSCHEVTVVNGEPYQKFSGIPINSCAECHEDVHNNRFGPNCKECHTEDSFHDFVGRNAFNHNQTGFPLIGKHRNVNCAGCHRMDDATASDVFRDFKGKDFTNCVTCHKDVHESKFGTDCRQCHSEESFQKIRNRENFNHDLTGYALEGKHEVVDCRKCHETKMTDPLPHNACADCHTDFHKGQFISENRKPDCRECHTVDGFEGSTYTIEQHNLAGFELTGAHMATPCFSCHLENDEWKFKNIGSQCNDCHTDVHNTALNEKYYPGKNCIACHSTENWASISFDHTLTGFALSGKHDQVSCTECHQTADTEEEGSNKIPFTGLNTACISCHDNIHGNQFEISGETDCRRCHDFSAWKPSSFDHRNARFVLDGAHAKVACSECHRPEQYAEGVTVIKYKLERFDCIDCHMDKQ